MMLKIIINYSPYYNNFYNINIFIKELNKNKEFIILKNKLKL